MNLELIRNLDFYTSLTQSEKKELEESIKEIEYKKNDLIADSGRDCKGILLIEEGEIRSYITSPDGREVTLLRVGKDEICVLAASCLMDTIEFDLFIDATEDTKLMMIPSYVLAKLSKSHIEVELFLYKESTIKFSDVMWSLQQILFNNIDKRIASYLWDESINKNSNIISSTHEEIAKNIGSAREVVTRALKYLSQDGIVSLSRGKIEIINKDALKKLIK